MRLQQLLGVWLPVIQAPRTCVQGSALVVAVSNAGALGCPPPPQALQQGLAKAFSTGHTNARNRLSQTLKDWQRIHKAAKPPKTA